VIAIIAKDRDQAKVIKNYIVGFMREIPAFADMIEDELAETVRLSNGVVVEVHTASIGAPRGRTFLAVPCDETAFWPMGDSANPDVEVINAVRPGLSTIPYSLLLIASSPYAKRGILYTNYAKYFGKDRPAQTAPAAARGSIVSPQRLSGSLRRTAERKELVVRSRQAEVLAQRRAFVLATK
jgi:hypothetical protein